MNRGEPGGLSARLYDFTVGPLNIALKRKRLQLAPPRRGLRVLDVGCGTGADLKLYQRGGCTVSGVDLSAAMLKAARKSLGAGADLRSGDAARLPFPDSTFDLVLSTYTLHTIARARRAAVLQELARVVKPGGKLLLTDFHPGSYRFPAGWASRGIILLLEACAGLEHCSSGMGFVRAGGLPGLSLPRELHIKALRLAGGGAIAFLLLKKITLAGKPQR